MQLRPFQHEAVAAVYDFLRRRDDNPCVVIPTGGGKSVVTATLCRDAVQCWNGRVLVLAHVKELLEQAADKLRAVAPDLPVGIYSAGLGRRDLGYAVTVASIQSTYKRARAIGACDLVIVDEAHLIKTDDEGMYRQLLGDLRALNPFTRVIGLTATPFRMKSGLICGPPPEHVLNEVCYEVSVKELIRQGYLCPLRSKAGRVEVDTSTLHVRGGEFVAEEVEALMDRDELVEAACAEVVEHARDRKSILVFTAGIRHGTHVQRVLEERHGVISGFIEGNTPSDLRAQLIQQFRAGSLKCLVNVNVLTHGFDAPNIDCVALLRPTQSPGLYYQMVGRSFRLHPGKADALVLDFGGNVIRHGPVDRLQIKQPGDDDEAPAKVCPACREVVPAGYTACPTCGHVFPRRTPRYRGAHEPTATTADILSVEGRTDHPVLRTYYAVHEKRGAPPEAPRSMRVDYQIALGHYVSEWICVEHPSSSFARLKADRWWRARSAEPLPEDAAQAVTLAQAGALAPTLTITVEVREDQKYDRIVGYQLGRRPAPLPEPEYASADDGAAPF